MESARLLSLYKKKQMSGMIPDRLEEWYNDIYTKAGRPIWGVLSSGETYNALTATVPDFKGILRKANPTTDFNQGFSSNGGIVDKVEYEGNITAGTFHTLFDLTNTPFKNVFITPAFRIYNYSGDSFQVNYITLSTINYGTNYLHLLSGQPPTAEGIRDILYAGTSVLMILQDKVSTTLQVRVFKVGVSISNLTLTHPKTNYLCLMCDGLNYWLGTTATIVNPGFTWIKVCPAGELSSTLLNFHAGGYRSTAPLQTTGSWGVNLFDWSGILPWL